MRNNDGALLHASHPRGSSSSCHCYAEGRPSRCRAEQSRGNPCLGWPLGVPLAQAPAQAESPAPITPHCVLTGRLAGAGGGRVSQSEGQGRPLTQNVAEWVACDSSTAPSHEAQRHRTVAGDSWGSVPSEAASSLEPGFEQMRLFSGRKIVIVEVQEKIKPFLEGKKYTD